MLQLLEINLILCIYIVLLEYGERKRLSYTYAYMQAFRNPERNPLNHPCYIFAILCIVATSINFPKYEILCTLRQYGCDLLDEGTPVKRCMQLKIYTKYFASNAANSLGWEN